MPPPTPAVLLGGAIVVNPNHCLLSSADLSTAASCARHICRCRLLPVLTVAATVGRACSHCRLLPSLTLAVFPRPARGVDIGQCPPSSAAPAAAAISRALPRRPPPLTPGTAASFDRFRRRPHLPLLSLMPAAPAAATMVNPGLSWSPQSVVEALGTRTIPAVLAAILAAHSRTFRKDGLARTPKERTGGGVHSFLSHLALGEVPFPDLERVTLVGVDKDRRVHLMHSLFSICVDVYSTEFCLLVCLGKLPAEGFPPVMEMLPYFFAARRFVRPVQRVDHIAHLGGISPLDGQTNSCKRATKAGGTDYIDLACRGLASVPSD